MRTEQVNTLILGAGPSGLAAGYVLAKGGLKPVVLERDKVCGGLMRSFTRGDFVLDIGRKELYNRLAKVDTLWSEILGKDYRTYPHRGGILYNGKLIDMSPAFQGFLRGMPLTMFFGCGFDFLSARLSGKKPRTLQEYFYQKRGRRLTQVFSQGFQEKLTGKKWADVALPEQPAEDDDEGLFATIKAAMHRAFSKKEVNTYKGVWRHPAKGTGQICDTLAQGIVKGDGRILFESAVKEIASSNGKITSVTAQVGAETVVFEPANLVSSIPLEFLIKLLFPQREGSMESRAKALDPMRRTVVLVYLFLDESPRFPHAWLQVTDPSTRVGRIANFSNFNGDMVPSGKTCICCEMYCFGEDPLLKMDNKQLAAMVLADCAKFGLVTPTKLFDELVLRLPGADASQNRDNWMSKARVQLMTEIKEFKNLYYVNRTETDIATLAGLEAGEAILAGDRAAFDERVDPARLQIRSESKSFEFRNPVAASA